MIYFLERPTYSNKILEDGQMELHSWDTLSKLPWPFQSERYVTFSADVPQMPVSTGRVK